MSKILYLTGSPRAERSHSTALADHLMTKLSGEVTTRNISGDVPFVTNTQIAYMYGFAKYEDLDRETRAAVDYQRLVVDEVLSHDTIVLAVPMWNLGMPAAVKAWFDQIIKIGETWKVDETGAYVGLARNIKKFYIVSTSSGVPMGEGHPWDHFSGHVSALAYYIGSSEVVHFPVSTPAVGGEELMTAAKAKIDAHFAA